MNELTQAAAFSVIVYVILGIVQLIALKNWNMINLLMIIISTGCGFALSYVIP